MTLPHDDRSPHRNQRWVECEGSGLQFGDCVEITESVRRESDGIRTIFQVTTPTEDSVANTIIIGHMEGSKGYCTNDFPTFAKCDQSAAPGDEVGPVARSRTLQKGQSGYLVMGDVSNGMARVRRKELGRPGRIIGEMLDDRTREYDPAGLTFGRANVRIDAILGSTPNNPGDVVEVIFGDMRWAGAVQGCTVIADLIDGVYSVTECQELDAGFWAITTEDRTLGAPDQDVICTFDDPTGHANADFSAQDWSQNQSPQQQVIKVRFKDKTFPDMRTGAIVWVTHDNDIINETSNAGMKWYAVQCDQLAHIIRTPLTAPMCGTDPAFGAISVKSAWPFSQKAINPHIKNLDNRAGKAGDTITCARDSLTNIYFIIAVTKHEVKAYSNYREVDNGQGCIEQRVDEQEFYTEICGDANTVVLSTFKDFYADKITEFKFNKNAVVSGSDTNCTPNYELSYERQRVRAYCESSTSTTKLISLAVEAVMRQIVEDGDCVKEVFADIITPGQCGSDTTATNGFICKNDCP